MRRVPSLVLVALALACCGRLAQSDLTSGNDGSDAGLQDADPMTGADGSSSIPRGDGCTPNGPANVFWADATAAASVVVDDANIYWWSNGGVYSCSLAHCETATVVASVVSVVPSSSALALDADDIYFLKAVDDSGGAIHLVRCPKTGCVGEPEQVSPAGSSPSSFLLDGTSIYWLDWTSGSPEVRRIEKNLTGYATIAGAKGLDAIAHGIIYWIRPPLTAGEPDGKIMSCPTTGCPGGATIFLDGQVIRSHLVVDDHNIYFPLNGFEHPLPGQVIADKSIASCPLAGCDGGPTTLASGLVDIAALAVDACGIYWATSDSVEDWQHGGVFMCERPACTTQTVVATGQYYPEQLAISAHALFWANYEGGNVASATR